MNAQLNPCSPRATISISWLPAAPPASELRPNRTSRKPEKYQVMMSFAAKEAKSHTQSS